MSKMRGYRKNSLVIDFTVLPAKPNAEDIRKFVFECLKLDIANILNIQLYMQKSYVFIELVPEIAAEDVANANNRKFCMTTDEGLQKQIPLFPADGAVEVKVFDLPPYMPNAVIAKALAEYGEVLSIKEETWHDFFPGVSNGTRVVRINLKKSIPSYITIEDMSAFVRYRNQTPTCKHCSRHLHIGKKCSEIKKALNGAQSGLTLAAIIQGINPAEETAPPAVLGEAAQSETPAPTGSKASLPAVAGRMPPPPDPVKPAEDNTELQQIPRNASDKFSISDEDLEDSEVIENTVDQDLIMEAEDSQESPPKITNRTRQQSQEDWKLVAGKRPGSPKTGSGKINRPSRSTSRK